MSLDINAQYYIFVLNVGYEIIIAKSNLLIILIKVPSNLCVLVK